jgi:hypothetical protein
MFPSNCFRQHILEFSEKLFGISKSVLQGLRNWPAISNLAPQIVTLRP